MSAAAVVASGLLMSRKRIIQQLIDLNAFDAVSAAPISLESSFDRWEAKSLIRKGVIVSLEQARFYLNREAQRALEVSEAKQIRAFVLILATFFVVVAAFLLLRK